jgi:hypothetical protein
MFTTLLLLAAGVVVFAAPVEQISCDLKYVVNPMSSRALHDGLTYTDAMALNLLQNVLVSAKVHTAPSMLP